MPASVCRNPREGLSEPGHHDSLLTPVGYLCKHLQVTHTFRSIRYNKGLPPALISESGSLGIRNPDLHGL